MDRLLYLLAGNWYKPDGGGCKAKWEQSGDPIRFDSDWYAYEYARKQIRDHVCECVILVELTLKGNAFEDALQIFGSAPLVHFGLLSHDMYEYHRAVEQLYSSHSIVPVHERLEVTSGA